MTKRNNASRAKLNVKEDKEKEISIFARLNPSKKVYSSGFCVTDNLFYALFYCPENFIIDNDLSLHENKFPVNENNLDVVFDREERCNATVVDKNILFDTVGLVNKELVDWFKGYYPDCVFHKVGHLYGKQVNTLVIVLERAFGKPVGILKAIAN